ncbi:hypothetical protein [Gemella sp. zg-1178]|uniref:hypothetical protein n=1 Tax=Gemella sp. zg-1178 TaxID=2840372 RepID=UPI001C05B379|nr:hypothetical protein [Gemella sp. zg-1178]MBU0279123.1 hypothetical protein [Gemella sp. zg-1178]
MIEAKIKEILEQRLDEEHFYYVECWKKEVEILTEDINETIEFVKNKCDDYTLFWMSEVFEDIIEKTKSKELLQVILERANRAIDENNRKEILKEVEYAKGHLI